MKIFTQLYLVFFFYYLFISISILYAQADELDAIYTLDLGLPPSGLNIPRAGEKISVLGDINGDGYDDWATIAGVDYESGSGVLYTYLFRRR